MEKNITALISNLIGLVLVCTSDTLTNTNPNSFTTLFFFFFSLTVNEDYECEFKYLIFACSIGRIERQKNSSRATAIHFAAR